MRPHGSTTESAARRELMTYGKTLSAEVVDLVRCGCRPRSLVRVLSRLYRRLFLEMLIAASLVRG